jgi:transposase InsO family protein
MSHSLQFLVFTMAGWLSRQQQDLIDYLREENRVLREQLGRERLRLTDEQRRRLAVRGKLLGRKALAEVAGIVTPDTILRWYRRLIAKKYAGSAYRGRGRPTTPKQIAELVVRMAGENPRWGYTRIRDALANLGHPIGRNTVKRILQDHGIEPASERSRRTPWKTFLQAHWEGLAAADLFTVEVLTFGGLRRYFVLFVIELKARRVKISGIYHQPYGEWMEQMARNLTDVVDGFLRNARHLIHDRDPLYTRSFDEILKSAGVQPVRLPPRSPNLNAYAERFVRSIKEECLNRVVVLGEGHLRLVIREYVEHYHRERNHQGLNNKLLERAPPPANPEAEVDRRERLGGLLNYYYREAA